MRSCIQQACYIEGLLRCARRARQGAHDGGAPGHRHFGQSRAFPRRQQQQQQRCNASSADRRLKQKASHHRGTPAIYFFHARRQARYVAPFRFIERARGGHDVTSLLQRRRHYQSPEYALTTIRRQQKLGRDDITSSQGDDYATLRSAWRRERDDFVAGDDDTQNAAFAMPTQPRAGFLPG